MRQVINKLIREDDLYAAVDSAYSQGWRRMKLYFLTGLPTETDEDTLGIAELAATASRSASGTTRQRVGHGVGRRLRAQAVHPVPVVRPEHERGAAAQDLDCCATTCAAPRACSSSGTIPRPPLVEGIVSRGDRRLGAVIEDVWRNGGTFQEWTEKFDFQLWLEAMARHGLSVDWYVHRHRTEDEVLPWDHLSAGLHKDFLWQDWRDALDELGLEDCRWTPCYDCGACTGYWIEHIVASATPPAGGSQGTGQDSCVATPVTRAIARLQPLGP